MALSLLLRRQISSKGCLLNISDVFTRQALKTSSFTTLQSLHFGRKTESACVLSQAQVSPCQLQQIQQFSTTNRCLSGAHGNHVGLWKAERIVSFALMGLLPIMFVIPSKVIESVTAIAVVMHMHWGLEAVFIDYVREKLFGPFWPKASIALCYILSIITLAGFFNIIFNDTGLANTIQMFWKL